MSNPTHLLMGEIIEDPEGQEKKVEDLLIGFLQALLEEQKLEVQ